MRILGLLFAYNEADCIANAVRAMKRCASRVFLVDHGSTDGTGALAEAEGALVDTISRKDVPPLDDKGRQNIALWRYLADFIRSCTRYDWVVFNAADDILREPDGRLATREGIIREHSRGIQVIRPLIRVFWPTTPTPENYLLEMRHYVVNRRGHSPRAWAIELTPECLPFGGHIQDPATCPKVHTFYGLWPEGTRVSNNEWLIDQYPFRSLEQARRKVEHERNWITPLGRRRYEQYVGHVGRIFGRQAKKMRLADPMEMP